MDAQEDYLVYLLKVDNHKFPKQRQITEFLHCYLVYFLSDD